MFFHYILGTRITIVLINTQPTQPINSLELNPVNMFIPHGAGDRKKGLFFILVKVKLERSSCTIVMN